MGCNFWCLVGWGLVVGAMWNSTQFLVIVRLGGLLFVGCRFLHLAG